MPASRARYTDVVEVDIRPREPDLIETSYAAQEHVATELAQEAHVSLSHEFSQLSLNNALAEIDDAGEVHEPGATSKARGGTAKQQMPVSRFGPLPALGGPVHPKVAIAELQPVPTPRKRAREESGTATAGGSHDAVAGSSGAPLSAVPKLRMPEREGQGDVTMRTKTQPRDAAKTSSSDTPSSGEDVALQRVAVAQSLEDQQRIAIAQSMEDQQARLLSISTLPTIAEIAEPPQQVSAAASSEGADPKLPTPRTGPAGSMQRMGLGSSTPKPKGPPQ